MYCAYLSVFSSLFPPLSLESVLFQSFERSLAAQAHRTILCFLLIRNCFYVELVAVKQLDDATFTQLYTAFKHFLMGKVQSRIASHFLTSNWTTRPIRKYICCLHVDYSAVDTTLMHCTFYDYFMHYGRLIYNVFFKLHIKLYQLMVQSERRATWVCALRVCRNIHNYKNWMYILWGLEKHDEGLVGRICREATCSNHIDSFFPRITLDWSSKWKQLLYKFHSCCTSNE